MARKRCDSSSPPVLTPLLLTNAPQLHILYMVVGHLRLYPTGRHMSGKNFPHAQNTETTACKHPYPMVIAAQEGAVGERQKT